LIDAGAKPEIAGKAAEESAAHDDRFDSFERTMLNKFAEAERSTSERFAESGRVMVTRFTGLDTRIWRLLCSGCRDARILLAPRRANHIPIPRLLVGMPYCRPSLIVRSISELLAPATPAVPVETA